MDGNPPLWATTLAAQARNPLQDAPNEFKSLLQVYIPYAYFTDPVKQSSTIACFNLDGFNLLA